MNCEKCGSDNLYLSKGDIHISLRCGECNAWIKFVGKKDINFLTKVKKYPMIEEEE